MNKKQKEETLELFNKLLDLKAESEDLYDEANELIKRCNEAINS